MDDSEENGTMSLGLPPITRRRALLGAAGVAATAVLAGCTNSANDTAQQTASTAGGPFDFTDDRGQAVHLDGKPTRIVAYAGSAAALWEYGIRPVGVFGPQKLADGSPDPQVGRVDLSAVTSLGNAFNEFDVPAYIKLAPELLISMVVNANGLWYVPQDSADEITGKAPTVGIRMVRESATKVIERYEALAKALGADTETDAIKQARSEFQTATTRLTDVAKSKGGLRVLAVYGSKDKPYIGNPLAHASLRYLYEAGVPITNVGDQADTVTWAPDLSWEQINRYPADLILYDVRTQALTLDQLKQIDVFNQLPAVKAGALVPWRTENPYTYYSYTQIANEVADAVAKATPGLV
ncbi:iron complex transport system substrate-binding protein [Amycolatopsis endophytica]|uniref:Iron complex transport system substrate-binding protein n=1 Tax=Amycolatopsis endophytica TaxID=860233 RepID=A0A853BDK6_9PSEU|nr:ABC transporter substrate-binding protein [Amycolatopsis endophytica]NYI92526.1 iron complex transport system substrate-binding protein [Amycolatopsis endophytica]